MVCPHCGSTISANARFCKACGKPIALVAQPAGYVAPTSLIGFSNRIHDPAFARYISNANKWAMIFAIILAIAAVVGFYYYGQTSNEMENPQAVMIGAAIGAMFILIAIGQIISRGRDSTWDGVVIDKRVEHKTRQENRGDDDQITIRYLLYRVVIRRNNGKNHEISTENDDTMYNYYQIGDRVRHHKGLNSYEKYDKSRDSVIFCNACGSMNDIRDDYCHRCKCPLLK
jgi:hypothetical protein